MPAEHTKGAAGPAGPPQATQDLPMVPEKRRRNDVIIVLRVSGEEARAKFRTAPKPITSKGWATPVETGPRGRHRAAMQLKQPTGSR
jgi:hypothetical protein